MGARFIQPGAANGGVNIVTHRDFEMSPGAHATTDLPSDWDGNSWAYSTIAGAEFVIDPIEVTIPNATDSPITGLITLSQVVAWGNFNATSNTVGQFVRSAWLTTVADLTAAGTSDVIGSVFQVVDSATASPTFTLSFNNPTVLSGIVTVPPGGITLYLHCLGQTSFEGPIGSLGNEGVIVVYQPNYSFIGA